jgi:hypothetical protein
VLTPPLPVARGVDTRPEGDGADALVGGDGSHEGTLFGRAGDADATATAAEASLAHELEVRARVGGDLEGVGHAREDGPLCDVAFHGVHHGQLLCVAQPGTDVVVGVLHAELAVGADHPAEAGGVTTIRDGEEAAEAANARAGNLSTQGEGRTAGEASGLAQDASGVLTGLAVDLVEAGTDQDPAGRHQVGVEPRLGVHGGHVEGIGGGRAEGAALAILCVVARTQGAVPASTFRDLVGHVGQAGLGSAETRVDGGVRAGVTTVVAVHLVQSSGLLGVRELQDRDAVVGDLEVGADAFLCQLHRGVHGLLDRPHGRTGAAGGRGGTQVLVDRRFVGGHDLADPVRLAQGGGDRDTDGERAGGHVDEDVVVLEVVVAVDVIGGAEGTPHAAGVLLGEDVVAVGGPVGRLVAVERRTRDGQDAVGAGAVLVDPVAVDLGGARVDVGVAVVAVDVVAGVVRQLGGAVAVDVDVRGGSHGSDHDACAIAVTVDHVEQSGAGCASECGGGREGQNGRHGQGQDRTHVSTSGSSGIFSSPMPGF